MRGGGPLDATLGEAEQADHDEHRPEDQQHLVPAALVGEQRDREGVRRSHESPIYGGSCFNGPAPFESPCDPVMMRVEVEATIEVIRPALQADGGDVVLRDVNEDTGVISVTLTGACGTCPASTQTLKAGIERIMKDRVDGVTEVVNVA